MILEGFSKCTIRLLADSAVILSDALQSHLILADLHLGKSATFRARGLAVPEGDTKRDLDRIKKLIDANGITHVVVAGDLFHANEGAQAGSIAELMSFIVQEQIRLRLVVGNHDRKIKNWPSELVRVDEDTVMGIRIVHSPDDVVQGIAHICGHVHPVVKIPDGKNTSLRMPCFHMRERLLTLPAFGSFTGGHLITPQDDDRFFVSHFGQVIELPTSILKRAKNAS